MPRNVLWKKNERFSIIVRWVGIPLLLKTHYITKPLEAKVAAPNPSPSHFIEASISVIVHPKIVS
jgi:hypothetical protein